MLILLLAEAERAYKGAESELENVIISDLTVKSSLLSR